MTPEQLTRLTALRHALHQIPEVSGQERLTARKIQDELARYAPDLLLTEIGGHGVAAVYDGQAAGPTVLIRCELDGLPIEELSEASYRSTHGGRGHLCGHDGHMVMVLALAEELARTRPQTGRVVLFFQPAEETGKGAPAVLADPQFDQIRPDYAISLHNLPGLARGTVAMCQGPANCASRGMRIRLRGRTSHAAAPQDGVSPAGALTQLMPRLVALGPAGPFRSDYALVTLTHSWLGEATFGVAPGEAEIWITLRTVTDARMAQLVDDATVLVRQVAKGEGLEVDISFDDVFDACTNHPEAAAIVHKAAADAGHQMKVWETPQPWSEDFGQFGKVAKTAMFWLGLGEDQPQLHNPDYDFPDQVIPVGASIFAAVIDEILNADPLRNS